MNKRLIRAAEKIYNRLLSDLLNEKDEELYLVLSNDFDGFSPAAIQEIMVDDYFELIEGADQGELKSLCKNISDRLNSKIELIQERFKDFYEKLKIEISGS